MGAINYEIAVEFTKFSNHRLYTLLADERFKITPKIFGAKI